MECLNPILIGNRTKVLSSAFADRLKYEVRCGKCANCQSTLSREWYFRAFYEYKDTIEKNGFMLMDCLTYAPKYVPRVSRYIPKLPRELNFMCFDYTDLRYFLVRLRRYLTKRGYDVENTLRYFCASEYGTDENRTHRPHMHILFYCTTPNLDNYTLSQAVAACWKYGRTDGIPYKSRRYVDDYTIRDGLTSSQRVCKYVSKYVMKSSEFQKVVDARIASIMYYLFDNKFTQYCQGAWCFDSIDYVYRKAKEMIDWSAYDSWLRSETAKSYLRAIRRHLNQFHRQSLGFGASYLRDCDINEVLKTNIVTIPDSKKIVMRIGLPMYYKRKLFYELVRFENGLKSWQLTDLGKKYKECRDIDLKNSLLDSFGLADRNYGYKIANPEILVDYVMNKRYRFKDAPFDGDTTIEDRIYSPNPIFNYSTPTDKHSFHKAFITSSCLGFSESSYRKNHIFGRIRKKSFDMVDYQAFLKQNAYIDSYLESILIQLKEKKRVLSKKIQSNFDNLQRLNQVYKSL